MYPTAREKKIRDFKGFHIRTCVVVPNDAEYQRRVQQREQVEGKEVPDDAVSNMKGN